MSDTDSFIDEVTEEVQREKLFRLFKRYGWIPVVAVVAIVGGTAWNEYRKAQARDAAQSLGDSVLQVLESDEIATQPIALSELAVPEDAEPVISLLVGATQMTNENPQAAVEALLPVASDQTISVVYRDLAALKIVMMPRDAVEPETRAQLLQQVIVPGAPYRLLGLEQQVIGAVNDGKIDEAIAQAQDILQETGVSAGLQQRLVQLIVALGGTVDTPAQTTPG